VNRFGRCRAAGSGVATNQGKTLAVGLPFRWG